MCNRILLLIFVLGRMHNSSTHFLQQTIVCMPSTCISVYSYFFFHYLYWTAVGTTLQLPANYNVCTHGKSFIVIRRTQHFYVMFDLRFHKFSWIIKNVSFILIVFLRENWNEQNKNALNYSWPILNRVIWLFVYPVQ